MDWIVGCVIFMVAFYSTFYLTKRFISRFHTGGHVVKDMYKSDKPDVPTMGGIALIGGIMISLITAQLLYPEGVEKLLIFYFVIFMYGVFGLLDDLISIKSRFKKVYIPFFLALPIGLLNIDTNLSLFFTDVEIGWLAPYLFAPLYVMVVSNLVNMHAGFNGLSGGLSAILVFFVGLKAYLKYDGEVLMFMLPLFGAILAFMWFNKYPSKIFLGNSGTLLIGAGVGGLIVLYNIEIFGVIILTPHIVNFLMWIYWVLNMKVHPHIKFAKVRWDGTLEPPNKLSLKYLVTFLFRVSELKATLILYGVTALFCILGLIATA
jgi:UDP-N-acetylglucosamine--dolichyl-phosphate N-acetylglucosaminephosphotransferase